MIKVNSRWIILRIQYSCKQKYDEPLKKYVQWVILEARSKHIVSGIFKGDLNAVFQQLCFQTIGSRWKQEEQVPAAPVVD